MILEVFFRTLPPTILTPVKSKNVLQLKKSHFVVCSEVIEGFQVHVSHPVVRSAQAEGNGQEPVPVDVPGVEDLGVEFRLVGDFQHDLIAEDDESDVLGKCVFDVLREPCVGCVA